MEHAFHLWNPLEVRWCYPLFKDFSIQSSAPRLRILFLIIFPERPHHHPPSRSPKVSERKSQLFERSLGFATTLEQTKNNPQKALEKGLLKISPSLIKQNQGQTLMFPLLSKLGSFLHLTPSASETFLLNWRSMYSEIVSDAEEIVPFFDFLKSCYLLWGLYL